MAFGNQHRWWLILLFIVNLLLTLHFLPPAELLNNKPLTNDDYPMHLLDIKLASRCVTNSRFSCYTRHFCGGDIFQGIGESFMDVVFVGSFLPSQPFELLIKLSIFLGFLVVPLLFYKSSRNMGMSRYSSTVVTGLGVFLWHFSDMIHNSIYNGLFPFYLALMVWLLAVSFLVKHFNKGSGKDYLLALGFWTYSLLIHPYSVLLGGIMALLVLVRGRHRMLAAPFLLLGLLPLTGHLSLNVPTLKAFHQGFGLTELMSTILMSPLFIITMVTGLLGYLLMKKRSLMLWLTLLLLIIGYTGGATYLWVLQPQRFLSIAMVLLILPSGWLIGELLRNRWRGAVAFILLVLVSCVYLVAVDYPFSEQWSMSLTTEVPAGSLELLDWMSNNTEPSGRVWLEGSGYRSNHLYGGHYNALFPLILDREFSNSPYPYLNKGINFIAFSEGDLEADGMFKGSLNLPISEVSCGHLMDYVNAFNVHWIIVWHNQSKRRFESCAEFKLIDTVGLFSIFKPVTLPTYFYYGNGTLSWSDNRIIVNSSSDRLVLKYRWDKSVRTEQGLPVQPFRLQLFDGHYVDLLLIENRGRSFKIPTC